MVFFFQLYSRSGLYYAAFFLFLGLQAGEDRPILIFLSSNTLYIEIDSERVLFSSDTQCLPCSLMDVKLLCDLCHLNLDGLIRGVVWIFLDSFSYLN